MDMMKNMYEDGDENMKKIIGEAMLKSQRGEKPSAPHPDDIMP
jgi:calcyclin binding protein